jgi:DNA-binding NarL/FixJ family response regulator
MTHIFLADALAKERAALRLMLLDLKMEVVGEADNWLTTLAQAPTSNLDMLLIEWSLFPSNPSMALNELRLACPRAIIVVLISHLDTRQQAARSVGADAFISKGETPDRVAERLRAAAKSIPPLMMHA